MRREAFQAREQHGQRASKRRPLQGLIGVLSETPGQEEMRLERAAEVTRACVPLKSLNIFLRHIWV